MLRITVRCQPGRITLRLEGRLLGPWVDALEENWIAALRARDTHSIEVDVTEVTFVDPRGHELLARMCAEGARLVAIGIESSTMVAGIQREVERRREAKEAFAPSPRDRRPS